LQAPFLAKTTKNPVFDALFKRYQRVDFINVAFPFLDPSIFEATKKAFPEIDEKAFPDFYRSINVAELTQDDYLLHYFGGASLLPRLLQLQYSLNDIDIKTLPMEEILSEIKNDTLKGEYVLKAAGDLKSYVAYTNLMEEYGHYILLPDQEKRAVEIITKLAETETQPGQPAINFSGKDINGTALSLSDFKGKVVYVDIWATWCGPCMREAPYFIKLTEEYKGKDIVFIGISIDVPKDKPKWEKYLEEKGIHGVQLFASNGWSSEVAKFYQVKSIPRFLLFDKTGNIVSTEAPRPSSDEIRPLLNKKLQEARTK
jgi:thiol-disulfide isomerase/thioredoxin